jgi:hypothetical protein
VVSSVKLCCWIAAILLVVLLALMAGGTALAQGPVISNVQAVSVEATSAVITWTTSQPGNSLVLYGNTTPPVSTASDSSYVTAHSVPLAGLTPSTQYYYEVRSTDQLGNTTIDNNGGSYYTFTTLERIQLEGWIWCTNFGTVADASFDGSVTVVDRGLEAPSASLHVVGDLTIDREPGEDSVIDLDMYGSRARSLFYLRQEITGRSVSLTGSWIDADPDPYYIYASGFIGLPNPEGTELRTGKLCYVMLRTPDVEVPLPDGEGFVADVESIVTRFTRLIDGLWDSLAGTGFRDFLGGILAKIAVIIASVQYALGGSYIP